VILALGLSGGALLTLVTLFNALLWRALPVSHPEALVGLSARDLRRPVWVRFPLPASLFASLDKAEQVFQEFAGYQKFQVRTAIVNDTRHRVAVEGVSGRYFATLGVRAALGRTVEAHEADSGAPVATISFRCWQTCFGSDPDVIGRTFRLQGDLMTVIGVAPRGFSGVEVGEPADAWVPASLGPRVFNLPVDLVFFDRLVGRLRPGVALEHARLELEALWPQARQISADASASVWPALRDEVLILEPRIESAARGFSSYGLFYRRTLELLVLSCATTIVLACANLSGLLLARWSTREQDLAVQAALGASKGRLVFQVVGESLALSIVAAILSAPPALWSARSLTLMVWDQPDASPLNLNPDYRVLGVMVALVGVIALAVSLLPASRVWLSNLSLSRSTRGSPGSSVARWGRGLAAAQVALSVPLLVTAWLIAANLARLESVNTGFQPDGVLTVDMARQGGVAPVTDPAAYLVDLASTLRAVPGLSSVALASSTPARLGAPSRRPVIGDDGSDGVGAFVVHASPGYFDTLAISIVAGRDFTWTDDSRQRDVAIVSRGLATALFAGASPIGRRVRLGGRALEVIGVVADAQLAEPHQTSQLFLFTPLLQQSRAFLQEALPVALLTSALPQRAVEPPARRAIESLGRHDVVNVRPLRQAVKVPLLRERVMRLGASYFAGLTTLLVFVGLFAMLNLGVTRRIPEIGLRIALGATSRDIRRLVIRQALVTAAAGLVVGIPCAFLSGRLIVNTLGLSGSHDAIAFAAAIGLILAVTVLSVLIPLRRASRITPAEALGSH
jgi:predicted permease